MKWVGMPQPTEEQIEEEAVSLIRGVMEWKKRNDRPGAKWKVGTTKDAVAWLENLSAIALSGTHHGSAHRAAQEISEYHGMRIEGTANENDETIYAYTDRPPTIGERRKREKYPLTLKQKLAFRAIKNFIHNNNKGPTKTELVKILGYRSTKTANGFVHILERKNWIIIREGQRRIELI